MSKCKLVYLKHSEIEVLLDCLEGASSAKHTKLIAKLTSVRNTKLKLPEEGDL